eukprot:CAMPEP_0179013576 /NCGR_PEP_ID=MMETSP0796-20121207/1798_1 /TAXON_ID=73915 /ORGANISM="Pyrodinium bahamense, Strain pbaha01" /LENGTH=35 /DNA_ID= /DNA_START= /DNA_END= /DNA_ORIENTATION=
MKALIRTLCTVEAQPSPSAARSAARTSARANTAFA